MFGTLIWRICIGRVTHCALRLVAVVTALSVLSCDAPAVPAPPSVAASRSAAVPPAAPLRAMPRAYEWRTISDAIASAGVRPGQVFASKFDWLFGDAAPRTGTFTGSRDGQQVWVDVHFLERPVRDVTVCADQLPAKEWSFTVAVNGQPQTLGNSQVTGAATAPLYFAMNDRYFLIASDMRLLSALRTSLSLSEPPC